VLSILSLFLQFDDCILCSDGVIFFLFFILFYSINFLEIYKIIAGIYKMCWEIYFTKCFSLTHLVQRFCELL